MRFAPMPLMESPQRTCRQCFIWHLVLFQVRLTGMLKNTKTSLKETVQTLVNAGIRKIPNIPKDVSAFIQSLIHGWGGLSSNDIRKTIHQPDGAINGVLQGEAKPDKGIHSHLSQLHFRIKGNGCHEHL